MVFHKKKNTAAAKLQRRYFLYDCQKILSGILFLTIS